MRSVPTGSNGPLRPPRWHSAARGKAHTRVASGKLKILFGKRVLRAFVLPIDRHNPPTLSVVEKLHAVDPAHERFRVAWIVTRFVCAPNVRNLAKLFDPPRNFFFVKAVLQKWFCSRDVTFDV